MKVIVAEGPLLDQITRLTYDIWNEGLSERAYSQWNAAQMRTPWGRTHLQRLALVDVSGRLLATAKRYRYHMRLDGRVGWMSGIGAVFTPPLQRGKGFASQLIEQLLEIERKEGALLAGLFSEIGATFYERLGFTPVPIDEVTVRVERRNGAPAMLVRAGDDRDLPALSKKRLLAGLGPQGLRQVEFVVAEEGVSAVAYALLHENANGWTLEEAGDRDPAGARLGGMLQVLLAREPSAPAPLIRAWWPAALAVPPQVSLTDRAPAHDLFMVKPLADVPIPEKAEDVFYWHSDYF